MTDEEIRRRLADSEDHFVERKTEGDHKDFLKTLVAFANSAPDEQPAILFIGVRRDGSVAGVGNPDSLQKTINDICRGKCYPPIDPHPVMRVLKEGDKQYLALIVFASKNRPHFGGPAWVRQGSETVVASEALFQELIDRRRSTVHEILKWKNQILKIDALGKRLGDIKPLGDPRYHESAECRIVDCNSHFLRFEILSSNRFVSEPLENVTVDWDEAHRRIRLVVRPARE